MKDPKPIFQATYLDQEKDDGFWARVAKSQRDEGAEAAQLFRVALDDIERSTRRAVEQAIISVLGSATVHMSMYDTNGDFGPRLVLFFQHEIEDGYADGIFASVPMEEIMGQITDEARSEDAKDVAALAAKFREWANVIDDLSKP